MAAMFAAFQQFMAQSQGASAPKPAAEKAAKPEKVFEVARTDSWGRTRIDCEDGSYIVTGKTKAGHAYVTVYAGDDATPVKKAQAYKHI
jgi:hypothetical protein